MGTRHLTIFRDLDPETQKAEDVAVLYGQYDGHPDSHGCRLAEFLLGFRSVETMDDGKPESLGIVANGIEDLALQTCCHFKRAPGGFYLKPCNTRDVGEDYTYTVMIERSLVRIGLNDYNVSAKGRLVFPFQGTPAEFIERYRRKPATAGKVGA